MFSRLCTDGLKGFLFGNFYLREFFTFSMQDFGLNGICKVSSRLNSVVGSIERGKDVNGSQK